MIESVPDSDISHFSHLTQPASLTACLLPNDLGMWNPYLLVLLKSLRASSVTLLFAFIIVMLVVANFSLPVLRMRFYDALFFLSSCFSTLQTLYSSLSPSNPCFVWPSHCLFQGKLPVNMDAVAVP